ncbi:hypothetical protein [Treponema sp.]|uniref:hypothetical protein n=1 Tax=Treponema sp. TaxID=166 RepID=UPI0025E7FB53|nr:hypothetical protein [Treponema sp.]MCR5218823.1 hypothetical protein [Treponema sp.]
MFNSIKKTVTGLLTALFFILLCALLSLAIAFPLWKWASISPSSYSIVIICAAALAVIIPLIKKIKGKVCRK